MSVAAALHLEGGVVREVRLACGGWHKPWRAAVAEAELTGRPATAEHFRAAIEAELGSARSGPENAFKVPMLRNMVVSVLEELRDGGTRSAAPNREEPHEPRRDQPSRHQPSRHERSREKGSVGQDRVRIDGPLKVTGTAPYAFEQPAQNPAYLFPLTSTIAKGKIRSIDDSAARALPGVLEVLTHENAPNLLAKTDTELYILQNRDVHYFGEYIGAVIAGRRKSPATPPVWCGWSTTPRRRTLPGWARALQPGENQHRRARRQQTGRRGQGLAEAALVVDEVYTTPYEHHNPMEMHSVIAEWDKEKLDGVLGVLGERPHLRIHDASQGVSYARLMLRRCSLLPQQVEINSPYVGGAFGSKGIPRR